MKIFLCINCINCKRKKNGNIKCDLNYFEETNIKIVKFYTPFDFECVDYEDDVE